MPNLTRRVACASAASIIAFPVVARTTAFAPPPPLDPVPSIFRAWCAARADVNRILGVDPAMAETDELRAAYAAEDAAFEDILRVEPTTMEGFAAVAHVLWDTDGPDAIEGSEAWSDQCIAPSSRMLATIWRAASGRDGMPRAT